MMSTLPVPAAITALPDGVYSDRGYTVEEWVRYYVESGDALREWLICCQRRQQEMEEYLRSMLPSEWW